jgi:hypothetical protein
MGQEAISTGSKRANYSAKQKGQKHWSFCRWNNKTAFRQNSIQSSFHKVHARLFSTICPLFSPSTPAHPFCCESVRNKCIRHVRWAWAIWVGTEMLVMHAGTLLDTWTRLLNQLNTDLRHQAPAAPVMAAVQHCAGAIFADLLNAHLRDCDAGAADAAQDDTAEVRLCVLHLCVNTSIRGHHTQDQAPCGH